jgi:hypothetical protein
MQSEGIIFCKIGKSSRHVSGKGGYFPYIDYIHSTIDVGKKLTFGKLENILDYLHYGDQLIIFSFSIKIKELKNVKISDNPLNKDFFDSNKLFVDKILPLNQPETIDYIFNNIYWTDIFVNTLSSYRLIVSNLKYWEETLNDPMFSCTRNRLWEKINQYYPNVAYVLKRSTINDYDELDKDFPELYEIDKISELPQKKQNIIIIRIFQFLKSIVKK